MAVVEDSVVIPDQLLSTSIDHKMRTLNLAAAVYILIYLLLFVKFCKRFFLRIWV